MITATAPLRSKSNSDSTKTISLSNLFQYATIAEPIGPITMFLRWDRLSDWEAFAVCLLLLLPKQASTLLQASFMLISNFL